MIYKYLEDVVEKTNQLIITSMTYWFEYDYYSLSNYFARQINLSMIANDSDQINYIQGTSIKFFSQTISSAFAVMVKILFLTVDSFV